MQGGMTALLVLCLLEAVAETVQHSIITASPAMVCEYAKGVKPLLLAAALRGSL